MLAVYLEFCCRIVKSLRVTWEFVPVKSQAHITVLRFLSKNGLRTAFQVVMTSFYVHVVDVPQF